MPPEEVDSSDEEEFVWTDYLKSTGSEAAPASCFCQSLIPPKNEFVVGNKLETFDPRNTTSTCIGTVIEVSGPRLRLRLDGTDDRNDFWLMVDSDLIHPYEYSAKNGRKIQPPLGFGNDLSKWPKFLEKIIQSSEKSVFAADSCFKTPPTRPLRNEFQIGHKLEAVDPKNPHLICPATIKDIKRDKLQITFDGWSQSSQFWCSFTSRDLFPVGWCKQADHILQHPGNLTEKKPIQATNTTATSKTLLGSPPIPLIDHSKIKQTSSSKKSKKKKSSTEKNLNKTSDSDMSSVNLTIDGEQNKSIVNNNEQENNASLNKIDLSIVKIEATEICDDSMQLNKSNTNGNELQNTDVLKTHNGHLNSVINSSETKNNNNISNVKNSNMMVIVYVVPNAECGKYIKTQKFHSSHTKFGPGAVSSVYKSILQSFVDCAYDRYEVFKLIPEGNSFDCVRLKNNNYNERKSLIRIETQADMWSGIKLFCNLLEIDEKKLFSKNKIANSSGVKENEFNNTKTSATVKVNFNNADSKSTQNNLLIASTKQLNSNNNNNNNCQSKSNPIEHSSNNNETCQQLQSNSTLNSLPLTPQSASATSTSSSSSSVSSSSSSENNNNQNDLNTKTNGKKRRLTASTSANNITQSNGTSDDMINEENNITTNMQPPNKSYKIDNYLSSTSICDWSVDQVVYYIHQLNDNNFSSYVDMFRHHEIDGKALLLLTTDILMKYLGFKLGPALKFNNYIDKLRQNIITIGNNNNNNNQSINNSYIQMNLKTECTY